MGYISHEITHALKQNTINNNNNSNNSVAVVSERTIPTEWPPLVGEVSANFYADRGVSRSQRGGSLKAVF
jgi:hypothetical protein